MNRPYTEFGQLVLIRLIEQGMTQAEFCRKHHIHPTRLSEIIHEERCYPRIRKKVARILGIKKVA